MIRAFSSLTMAAALLAASLVGLLGLWLVESVLIASTAAILLVKDRFPQVVLAACAGAGLWWWWSVS